MENFKDPAAWYTAAKYVALTAAGFGVVALIIALVGLLTGHAVWR